MAAERGYREIREDKERPPRESLKIDEKKPMGLIHSVNQKEVN